MSDEDVHKDTLFVGLTRPTTALGIPYKAFVIEVVGTAIFFIASGDPLNLLVAAPIHGILYLIAAKDPNIFHALALWLKTFGRCPNERFWGAASFSPLSTSKWSDFRVRENKGDSYD